MQKIPATVTVLTKNSGDMLEKALETVKDFDEIVICDGGSTDDTLDIARRFGAKIIEQDKKYLDEHGKIFDFSGVHNQMLEAAKHNWIFSLDSDEKAGSDLVEAIRTVISQRGEDGAGVFWVNRKYVLNDKVIDCAATYPNRQTRFFAKNSTHGYIKKVHERLKLKDGVTFEFLASGNMYLPFPDDLQWLRRKWSYQIAVAVEQAKPITVREFLYTIYRVTKVSALWFARLAYNYLFCSGNKMPLKYEMERHYFHLRLLREYWKAMRL